MNIWDVYEYNNTLLNKSQSGRSFTVDQFNLVAPFAQYEFMKQRGGLPEDYKVGMPLSPIMWNVNQRITDDCRHLLIWMGGPDDTMMNTDQYGVATVPSNYLAFSSCYFDMWVKEENKYEPCAIEFVPDAAWADRLKNPIKYPTQEYPVAKWFGDKIQFAPANMNYLNFSYLRVPTTPFLSVTLDANNDYEYDAAGSTQFDFPDVCVPDIAAILRLYQAGNIQSQLYVQMAEKRKMTGI